MLPVLGVACLKQYYIPVLCTVWEEPANGQPCVCQQYKPLTVAIVSVSLQVA